MISCVICAAEATVFCLADKACLCRECDVKVHTSNPVAARHQRMPPCEGGCSMPATVFCKNCSAYTCEACHAANPLSASHATEPAAALPPVEQEVPAAEPAQYAPCESVAQSAPSPDSWFVGDFASDKPDMQAMSISAEEPAAVTPTGSEAVVPVISAPYDEFAFAAPASFKDIKDKLEFEELDGNWMEGMNFDFSDILSDAPSDAGLVPTFDPVAAAAADMHEFAVPTFITEGVPEVPIFDMPSEDLPLEEEEEEVVAVPSRKRSTSGSSLAPPAKVQAVAPAQLSVPQQQPAAFPMFPSQLLSTSRSGAAAAAAAAAAPVVAVAQPRTTPAFSAAAFAASGNGANLTREQRVARYREKRKNRKFEKTIRYASRKAYAEIRPRIKGRFAKKEEIEAWKAAHGGDDAVVPEILDEC